MFGGAVDDYQSAPPSASFHSAPCVLEDGSLINIIHYSGTSLWTLSPFLAAPSHPTTNSSGSLNAFIVVTTRAAQ